MEFKDSTDLLHENAITTIGDFQQWTRLNPTASPCTYPLICPFLLDSVQIKMTYLMHEHLQISQATCRFYAGPTVSRRMY